MESTRTSATATNRNPSATLGEGVTTVPTAAATATPDSQLDGEEIITFPRGILGFEDCRRFHLVRHPEWEPLAKLQSIDQPRLSFVLAPPRLFVADYSVRIDPLEVAELEIRNVRDAETWAIVTVPDDPRQMSANLQGPLIINRASGKGKQVVLTRTQYSTQQMMFTKDGVPE